MDIKDRTAFQTKNWSNFCHYHLGDWYGNWYRYSSSGNLVEQFKCIRSFKLNPSSSEVNQENHYTYTSGTTETKIFPPHTIDTKALFLDNAFSFGSTQAKIGSKFGFETTLKSGNRRVGVAGIYSHTLTLERVTIIIEQLNEFPIEQKKLIKNQESNWQGMRQIVTSELEILSEESIIWYPLYGSKENYLTINHLEDILVTCPKEVTGQEEFNLVVNWQINSVSLLRASRVFKNLSYMSFICEDFKQTV